MKDTIVVRSQAEVDAIPQQQRSNVDLVVENSSKTVIVGVEFASVDYVDSKGLTTNKNVRVRGQESFVVARCGATVVVLDRATVEMNQVRGCYAPSTVYALDLSTVLVTSDQATRYVGTVAAYDNAFVHVDAKATVRAYDKALVRNVSDFADITLVGNAKSSFYGDAIPASDSVDIRRRLRDFGVSDNGGGDVTMYTLDYLVTGEDVYPPVAVYPTIDLAQVAHRLSFSDPVPTIHEVYVPYVSLDFDPQDDQFWSLASLELGEEVDL
jgi:hypothetical protein|nr:MAG TPA: hypothetical protein [Caudoviricetes sp.]